MLVGGLINVGAGVLMLRLLFDEGWSSSAVVGVDCGVDCDVDCGVVGGDGCGCCCCCCCCWRRCCAALFDNDNCDKEVINCV